MKFFDRLSGLFRREPVRFSTRTTGPSYTPAIDYTTKSILPGRIHLGGSLALSDWRTPEQILRAEIARLKRNKKKHSHLQKELDALISGGASSDTNNGDTQ